MGFWCVHIYGYASGDGCLRHEGAGLSVGADASDAEVRAVAGGGGLAGISAR